ncbi:FG-GAP repeat protein [Algibacter lectus]|uniref:DNA polymerase-like protein PA0670 n=1 Tax=Algibacter lectus TaxID=221126 RepID=A0A090VK73_9FLAO|nr:FG-GAP repeat protein [Algibacter lectus]GAL63749.1 DNA polymerase-like protein PA0670 [Algibacter lectus]
MSWSDDGKTLAIGVHDANVNGENTGHVRVYKNNSGVWNQVGVDINGEKEGDWFGYSVSLSNDGTTVAIGAKRNHGRNGKNSGHVRVYKNNLGVWKQVGADIDGESEGDWSGYSVSLSGDGATVAIGAVLNSGNGNNSGHVRVYKNRSGVWTQVGQNIDGKATKDYFGASVSLSNNGTVLAIGAHQGGRPSGYVSVYKNVSGNWLQIGDAIVGESVGNFSGWNLSLSSDGSIVAIGAYMNNDKGVRYSYVRAYQNRSNTWIQKGADIDGKTTGYDVSGFNSISLSGNDTIILIGAYEKNSGNNKQTLAINYVRVYKYKDSLNIWNKQKYI